MIVSNSIIYLQPWTNNLAADHAMEVSIEGNILELMPIKPDFKERVDGMYAIYPEGTFLFFRSAPAKYYIGWNRILLEASELESVGCNRTAFSNIFFCENSGGEKLNFKYHTLKGSLFPPTRFMDYFIDTDWDLYADLPGFVQTVFLDSDDSFEDAFERFKVGYEKNKTDA